MIPENIHREEDVRCQSLWGSVVKFQAENLYQVLSKGGTLVGRVRV